MLPSKYVMKRLRVPAFIENVLSQEHVVCWFSSRELFLSWEKKKKQVPLTGESGFSGGQIHNFDQAVATVEQALSKEEKDGSKSLKIRTLTVFVATASSPLERSLVRRVFQKAGFQKISLVSYATALRAFAERQTVRTGVGVYQGYDAGEAMVFDPESQATVALSGSLSEHSQLLVQYVREHHGLEISFETAEKLYAFLGKKTEPGSFAVRGRALKNQQVETHTLSAAHTGALLAFFEHIFSQELLPLVTHSVFQSISPKQWVVVGDALLNRWVQTTHQAESIFLRSESEMIQGVQWLS